jgi:hypothetical protein
MSLEASITDLAAAIRELARVTTLLRTDVVTTTTAEHVPAIVAAAGKREASDAMAAKAAAGEQLTAAEAVVALNGQHAPKAEASKSDAPKSKKTEAAPKVEAAAAKPEAPAIKYDAVRDAILDVAAKFGGPNVAVVLAPFGVKRGQELKPEQWAAARDAARAFIANGGKVTEESLA